MLLLALMMMALQMCKISKGLLQLHSEVCMGEITQSLGILNMSGKSGRGNKGNEYGTTLLIIGPGWR